MIDNLNSPICSLCSGLSWLIFSSAVWVCLNFSLFIDVSDTQLHYLTVWKTKKDWEISFKKAKEYSDVKAQVKEMGATMSIVGGDTSGRMTSKSNFNLFENVSL